ncbi:MAG: helix-turn-helix domain-containing protein [Prevotellamassilia sp.]|nr:helix-turn-helix domain-containing protein [Bacteroidales bacterium]MDD6501057.1 helix-turn-helix domain-containing protein [Bacteroidales bacterium]MDD7727201.1 helix-turn-helix domain-containing protein [Bacteroidales bacterium]MDY4620020.1 helix-turn-helix domain-containing protein [Alloprevotella sp.]MEE1270509.1 helix-turn-helix domain-containing protein [Prevotellamassilia sp.]
MQKKENQPSYLKRISTERADEIYVRLLQKLTSERRYRDPKCTAKLMAEELGTNTRYISSAVALATGGNYSQLINKLRVRDACNMLSSALYKDMSLEEIGLLAGYASRQAFYLAFSRLHHCTPRAYRLEKLGGKKSK